MSVSGTEACERWLATQTSIDVSVLERVFDVYKPSKLDLSYRNLSANGVVQCLAKHISSSQTLQHLNLEASKLGVDGIETLSQAVTKNPKCSLRSLLLRSNDLGPMAGIPLGQMLRVNTGLSTLDLSHNTIGEDGMNYIIGGLQSNTASGLQLLNLSHNNISRVNFQTLEAVLTLHQALQINLLSNPIKSPYATQSQQPVAPAAEIPPTIIDLPTEDPPKLTGNASQANDVGAVLKPVSTHAANQPSTPRPTSSPRSVPLAPSPTSAFRRPSHRGNSVSPSDASYRISPTTPTLNSEHSYNHHVNTNTLDADNFSSSDSDAITSSHPTTKTITPPPQRASSNQNNESPKKDPSSKPTLPSIPCLPIKNNPSILQNTYDKTTKKVDAKGNVISQTPNTINPSSAVSRSSSESSRSSDKQNEAKKERDREKDRDRKSTSNRSPIPGSSRSSNTQQHSPTHQNVPQNTESKSTSHSDSTERRSRSAPHSRRSTRSTRHSENETTTDKHNTPDSPILSDKSSNRISTSGNARSSSVLSTTTSTTRPSTALDQSEAAVQKLLQEVASRGEEIAKLQRRDHEMTYQLNVAKRRYAELAAELAQRPKLRSQQHTERATTLERMIRDAHSVDERCNSLTQWAEELRAEVMVLEEELIHKCQTIHQVTQERDELHSENEQLRNALQLAQKGLPVPPILSYEERKSLIQSKDDYVTQHSEQILRDVLKKVNTPNGITAETPTKVSAPPSPGGHSHTSTPSSYSIPRHYPTSPRTPTSNALNSHTPAAISSTLYVPSRMAPSYGTPTHQRSPQVPSWQSVNPNAHSVNRPEIHQPTSVWETPTVPMHHQPVYDMMADPNLYQHQMEQSLAPQNSHEAVMAQLRRASTGSTDTRRNKQRDRRPLASGTMYPPSNQPPMAPEGPYPTGMMSQWPSYGYVESSQNLPEDAVQQPNIHAVAYRDPRSVVRAPEGVRPQTRRARSLPVGRTPTNPSTAAMALADPSTSSNRGTPPASRIGTSPLQSSRLQRRTPTSGMLNHR